VPLATPRLPWAPCVALMTVLLGACAAGPQFSQYKVSGQATELNSVPYLEQDGYQGGPAALAMMLGASGVQVTPADLLPQTWNAKVNDSPRPWLIATTTRYGRVPFLVRSHHMDLEAVKLVQAGHPLMVLLHTGAFSKHWLFAVVTGIDPGANEYILRSGSDRRFTMSYGGFVADWKDGGYWAMLTQRPGDIPDGVSAQEWMAAAEPFTQAGKPEAALQAYGAVTQRWPREGDAWIGMGKAYAVLHNLTGATTALQNAINVAPRNAAAYDTLAQVLLQRQCADQAEEQSKLAVRLEPDPARRAAYQQTLKQAHDEADGPSVVCQLE
jgi:hypothetical protein